MTNRHRCYRRGNATNLEAGTLEPLPLATETLVDGGIWFGYIQDGADFFWVSANHLELKESVAVVAGRHMGAREDGTAKWFGPSPTSFDDGGASTILIDAVAAHGGKDTHWGGLLVDVLLGLQSVAASSPARSTPPREV